MSMQRAFQLLLVVTLVSGCSHSDDLLRPPAVASVGISPGAFVLTIGHSRQMTATPRDALGNPLTGRTVRWSVDDANVARISADGQLTGTGHGYLTITATVEGKSRSVAATVVPPELGQP